MDQTYTKTQTDLLIAGRHSYADGLANTNAIATLQTTKANVSDVYNKTQIDTSLGLKTNTSTTTALTNRVVDVEGASVLNANAIIALSNNVSTNYYTKTVVDTSLDNKTDK